MEVRGRGARGNKRQRGEADQRSGGGAGSVGRGRGRGGRGRGVSGAASSKGKGKGSRASTAARERGEGGAQGQGYGRHSSRSKSRSLTPEPEPAGWHTGGLVAVDDGSSSPRTPTVLASGRRPRTAHTRSRAQHGPPLLPFSPLPPSQHTLTLNGGTDHVENSRGAGAGNSGGGQPELRPGGAQGAQGQTGGLPHTLPTPQTATGAGAVVENAAAASAHTGAHPCVTFHYQPISALMDHSDLQPLSMQPAGHMADGVAPATAGAAGEAAPAGAGVMPVAAPAGVGIMPVVVPVGAGLGAAAVVACGGAAEGTAAVVVHRGVAEGAAGAGPVGGPGVGMQASTGGGSVWGHPPQIKPELFDTHAFGVADAHPQHDLGNGVYGTAAGRRCEQAAPAPAVKPDPQLLELPRHQHRTAQAAGTVDEALKVSVAGGLVGSVGGAGGGRGPSPIAGSSLFLTPGIQPVQEVQEGGSEQGRSDRVAGVCTARAPSAGAPSAAVAAVGADRGGDGGGGGGGQTPSSGSAAAVVVGVGGRKRARNAAPEPMGADSEPEPEPGSEPEPNLKMEQEEELEEKWEVESQPEIEPEPDAAASSQVGTGTGTGAVDVHPSASPPQHTTRSRSALKTRTRPPTRVSGRGRNSRARLPTPPPPLPHAPSPAPTQLRMTPPQRAHPLPGGAAQAEEPTSHPIASTHTTRSAMPAHTSAASGSPAGGAGRRRRLAQDVRVLFSGTYTPERLRKLERMVVELGGVVVHSGGEGGQASEGAAAAGAGASGAPQAGTQGAGGTSRTRRRASGGDTCRGSGAGSCVQPPPAKRRRRTSDAPASSSAAGERCCWGSRARVWGLIGHQTVGRVRETPWYVIRRCACCTGLLQH